MKGGKEETRKEVGLGLVPAPAGAEHWEGALPLPALRLRHLLRVRGQVHRRGGQGRGALGARH